MKIFTKNVDKCKNCPNALVVNSTPLDSDVDMICKVANRALAIQVPFFKLNSIEIPKWCPLEDKK